LHRIRTCSGLPGRLAALLGAALAACGDAPQPAAQPALLPPPPAAAQGCDEHGYLRTTFYGAFDGDIDWASPELDCEGMPRPDSGARLRFAGNAGELRVALIIAIPELARGETARELGANVTLIEEGSGRFFSTTGLGNCWTDIEQQAPLSDGDDRYSVSGTLYCIAPLAEVNGDSSVALTELLFAGLVDWGSE